jgi:haloacetate dehalogenase
VERRAFLTAVSTGSLVGGPLAQLAEAQTSNAATSSDSASFKTAEIDVAGNKMFYRRYGQGPGILMVHGFPRTSLMWRFLAPKVAGNHTVICADLRAYGRSGIPASADDHFPYSKRAMAKELVEVMVKLGFPTFTLIGHDRGGRVAYRMALDHPKNVERLAVFDVIPILEAWSRSDASFAQAYWPWILLSQKQPLPESYLLGAPEAVFHNPFGQGSFGTRFSKNTFPPIAILPACMESVRSIEPQRRSMLNMIALIRRFPSESNAQCCIYGRRVVRSTLFM